MRDADGNGAGVGATDCRDGTSVESGCAEGLLPEFNYTAVPARFRGVEASAVSGSWTPRTRWTSSGAPTWSAPPTWRTDSRFHASLHCGWAPPWLGPAAPGRGVGADHFSAQTPVPMGELTTGAYTLWNAGVSYRSKAGPASLLWHARLENAGNSPAYSATALLTQTGTRVPLPGRSACRASSFVGLVRLWQAETFRRPPQRCRVSLWCLRKGASSLSPSRAPVAHGRTSSRSVRAFASLRCGACAATGRPREARTWIAAAP